MGLTNFTIYDQDTIEAHNLASQSYPVYDVERRKIASIGEQMLSFNPEVKFETHAEWFTGVEQVGSILISAVDSMDARRKICENLPPDTFVFDGRMGGGQIEVHSQSALDWAKTLEKDGDDDPCGARFISYTSYVMAGLIANQVKRYLMKQRMAKTILLHMDTLELITVF
jgi:hypothetical protein